VISLPKPTLTLSTVLGALGVGSRVDNLRHNALALIADETLYDQLGDAAQLFTFPQPGSSTVGADAKWAYKVRFAAKTGLARALYAELKEWAFWSKCPLCHHRPVGTLDHYLPQASFPTLALTPLNLVPVCRDCNWVKQNFVAATESEQPLHPYYDDFAAAGDWLEADLVEESGAPLVFRVDPLDVWTAVEEQRVRNHFRDLELNDLYAANAGAEVQAIRARLSDLLDAGGPAAVAEHLLAEAESRSADLTDAWRPAAYRAWGANDWFCSGGFDE
jgi:hypothetical protein